MREIIKHKILRVTFDVPTHDTEKVVEVLR